jgi:hypothetical protein
VVSNSDELATDEAYAFLNVVAPRLEQLRRRLVVANNHLKSGDPEQARLNAILESQTAIREFLASIPHLSALVEPIDVLLDAVREDPAPEPNAALEDAPEPEPEPEVEPDPPPTPPPPPAMTPAVASPARQNHGPSDAWLQIGTALIVDRLTNAGMPANSAESHVYDLYASLKLSQANGSPISVETIRDWRSGFASARKGGGWRGNTIRRKVTTRTGINPVVDAQQRVAEMAAIFKKMIQLGASLGKGR